MKTPEKAFNQYDNFSQQELNLVLATACLRGDLESVKYFLTSPELVTHAQIDTNEHGPLRWACQNGHLEIVRYLLSSPDLTRHCDIHVNDDDCLVLACEHGNLALVRYLLTSSDLDEHADIHARHDRALSAACKNNNLEVVRYLLTSPELNEHSHIHAKDDYALDIACQRGHLDIVRYLLTSAELTEHANLPSGNVLQKVIENERTNVLYFLVYDLKLQVTFDMYQEFDGIHGREHQQELRHLIEKRNLFLKINHDFSDNEITNPSRPKI